MSAALELHSGEERVFTVSISEDGVPLDLNGYTNQPGEPGSLSAEVWWGRKKRFTLGNGSGLEILDLSPSPPEGDDDPAPQYQLRLSELQTDAMPLGRVAYLHHVRISPDGVTAIRGPIYFEVSP